MKVMFHIALVGGEKGEGGLDGGNRSVQRRGLK